MSTKPHTLEIRGLRETGRVEAILLDGQPLCVTELRLVAGTGKPTEVSLTLLVQEVTVDAADVACPHLTLTPVVWPPRRA